MTFCLHLDEHRHFGFIKTYTLSLSLSLSLSVRNNAFLVYDYMATSWHNKPCLRGHEIYNLGRPFLGQPASIEDFWVGSNEIYNCLSTYSKNATYRIWSRP